MLFRGVNVFLFHLCLFKEIDCSQPIWNWHRNITQFNCWFVASLPRLFAVYLSSCQIVVAFIHCFIHSLFHLFVILFIAAFIYHFVLLRSIVTVFILLIIYTWIA